MSADVRALIFFAAAATLVALSFGLSGSPQAHISWHHVRRLVEKYPVYGGIIVFCATQMLAFTVRRYDEYMRRRQIRRGLYHEILHNIDTTQRSHLNRGAIQAMCAKILSEAGDYRPLIVVTYEDVFYKGIVRDLPLLSLSEIRLVNCYYFAMNQLKSVADSVERTTFFLISREGRTGLIEDIGEAYEEVVDMGERVARELKPGVALRRLLRFTA